MDLPDLSPDRSLVENKILKSFSDNFLQDEFEELHGQPPEKKMKYDFEAMEQVQKCNLLPKHPKIILKADLGLSLDKNNPLTVDSPSNVPQIIQRDEIAALKSDEVVSESQVIASEDNQINVMKDKIAAPKSDEVLITNDEIAASKQAQVVVLGSNEETICKKKIISDGKPIGQLKVQVLPSPKFGSITLKNASLLTTPGASPASTDMFWTGKINSIKSTSKFPNNIYSNILHKTLVKATNCSKAEKKEIIVEPEVIDIENNTNNNSTELPESKIKTKNEIVKPIKKNFNGTVKPKILNNLILDKKSIMSPNQQSPIQFVNIKTLQNGQRVVVVNKSKQSLLKEPVSHKSIDSGTLNSTTCESNKQSKVHPNLSKIEILSKVTEPSATKIELIKLNKNLEKLKNNGISTAILANNSNISYNPFHKFNKTNSLANDKLQPKYEDETWCDDQEDFRYKLNDLEKLPLQQNTRNNRQLVNKNRNINNIEITKRAIKTVKNDKVFKAVKALESCGVEVSEIVAVPSEEIQKNKIINNSATQTEVFSLLENGEFIEATTLKKDVTRLKLVNDVTVQSENINLVGLDLKENFKNKLDNMLKKNFPNCKQITFAYTTSDIVSKINQQLQRDYYNAKNFDNNGLLGIHRAVRANDLRQVQRHLLIVRMLRQDIDINTECGKTSLELAVKYDVDPHIANILLREGAQPVINKTLHNSALVIAAKNDSKLLSMLLKYITNENRVLINCKDDKGLTALHYCVQNGNIDGVKNLIATGADVDIQDDRSGKTALIYAIEARGELMNISQEVFYKISHILIENGADASIPTFSKATALSLIDDIKSHSLRKALNKAIGT